MAERNMSKLYLACRDGDFATFERLLSSTRLQDLNRLEPNGNTCLHAASYYGHPDIVRRLLEQGASRSIRNRDGCTPLELTRRNEVANLFPRSTEEAKNRFSVNPAKQPEWQFEQDSAESFSRAIHWGCMKDRGVKKTVKKLNEARALEDDEDVSAEIVQNYFQEALQSNNPILLLKAYTVESQFYKTLNQEMATGSRREVFKKLCKGWTGYYTGIIARNPAFEPYRFSGQTYRGMQITPSDFHQYKLGVALTNKSFQSTSKSWKISKGFACPSEPKPDRLPVILIFTITDRRSALSIENISEYQYEEEVLIMPGTLFIVTNVNTEERPHEIELKQLEWKNEF